MKNRKCNRNTFGQKWTEVFTNGQKKYSDGNIKSPFLTLDKLGGQK